MNQFGLPCDVFTWVFAVGTVQPHHNRKLRDIADSVVLTGTLDLNTGFLQPTGQPGSRRRESGRVTSGPRKGTVRPTRLRRSTRPHP